MNNRTATITRSTALLWFLLGLVFMFNDTTSGSIFFILGLTYLAKTSPAGEKFATQNPGLAMAITLIMTVLLLALVGILFFIRAS